MAVDEPRYQKTVLDNGVRVITEHMPLRAQRGLGLWVGVGSSHEDGTVRGISHLHRAHALQRHARPRSARQIAETMDSVGGISTRSPTKK